MASTITKTDWKGIYSVDGSDPIRYRVIVTTPSGKQRKATAPNLKEAKRLRAELLIEVSDGALDAASHTVQSYYDEWILKLRVRKPTLETYRGRMQTHILPALGKKKLRDLRTHDIEDLMNDLTDKGYGPNVVQATVCPLSSMLTSAMRRDLIRFNPCKNAQRPKRTVLDTPKPKALTDEQVDAIFAHLPSRDRLFFEFLLKTGLRISEALAIRWMDWQGDRIVVNQRWSHAELNALKNGKPRSVPVSNNLSAALTALRLDTEYGAPTDLIFPSSVGRYQEDAQIARRALKPARAGAGLPWVTFHTFRHTFASRAYKSGVPLGYISEMLGHATPQFTWSQYVTVFDADLSSVSMDWADKLDPTPTTNKEEVFA